MEVDIESIGATLRAYGQAAGALRAIAIVDRGDGEAGAMVEWTPDALVATLEAEELEDAPLRGDGEAFELPDLRAVPASAVHVDLREPAIHAPVGAVGHLVDGVRALAAAFGGLSVATAEFATADPDLTLTLAAREGEPVIAAVGDAQFELG